MNNTLTIKKDRLLQAVLLVFILNLFGASVFAQATITSAKSGNWSNNNTWVGGHAPGPNDNAIIATGHTVTFVSTNSVHNLTIYDGAIINDNGLANTISGNLEINGTFSGTGPINLTGNSTSIAGTGIISNTATIVVTGNKTIPLGTDLTINNANLIINGAYTITNYGTFSCGGNITGTVAGSTWTNEVNSTLNIGGNPGSQIATALLNSVGILNASASGNTVNYTTPASVTIKLPSMVSGYNTYHNLIISGTNVKFLPNGNIAVNGDLTINSTLNASGNAKKLFLRGNWINNGNFTEGSGSGSITIDGTADQSFFRSATENVNIFEINKPSGTLFLNTSVVVESALRMISGNINVAVNKVLTTGTSGVNPGIILWTSGTVIGKIERWLNPSFIGLPVDYPVGTAAFHRHITVVFNDLSSGSLAVEFKPVAPGNNGLPLTESGVSIGNTFRDGYWSLTEGNSLDTVDFTLSLNGVGFDGFPINDSTRLLTRTNSSSVWTLNGNHVARTGNTIRRSSIDQLGEFCFGSNASCTAPSTSAIAGNNSVCTSTTNVPYSVTNTPLSIYTWTIIGGTQASGGASSSITVDWGTTGEVGSVSVVEDNGCTLGADIARSVSLNPIPPASITGKVSVPQNALPNPPYESANETYTVPAQSGYTFVWSVSGGTIASISANTRTIAVTWGLVGAGQVCVQSVHPTCSNSVNTCLDINIYEIITSKRSGNWNSSATWDCACVPTSVDNVTILNTHAVTVDGNSGNGRTIQHVNVNPGGILNIGTSQLAISGDFSVSGTVTGSGPITLSGAGTIIDGTGTTLHTGQLIISGNKTILATTNLAKTSGVVLIGASSIVTNFGNITFGGDVTGGDINTTWDNKAGAQLTIAAAFLAQGELIASGNNNFVRYTGSVAQSIKEATDDQYYNLTLAGTGTKTLPPILKLMGDLNYSAASVAHNNGTVIFNGSSSVIGTFIENLNNVTITGSLTAPSTTFNIAGAFVNNGTFIHNSGTIGFNGSLGQTISGSVTSNFYNLNVNKGGGALQLASNVNLVNSLTIQSATDVQSNGKLTLQSKSDAPDTTASIAALPSGAMVSGNVIVQRYMSNEGRLYRYLSSPVSGATVADWMDDFPVTGKFPGRSTQSQWPLNTICSMALIPANASLFYYDETVSGVEANGYIAYPPTNTSLSASNWPLTVGMGFAPYIRKCNGPLIVDVTGPVNQGPISFDFITYTDHDHVDDGWNLVGNPYPSAIDWDVPESSNGWTKTNISPIIAVRDNGGSMVRYWDGDDSGAFPSELPGGMIASGQGFWVRTVGAGPSLIIREGAKVPSNVSHAFYRKPSTATTTVPFIAVSLKKDGMEDKAFLKVRSNSVIETDEWDAPKLKNEDAFGIATVTPGGKAMAINAVPEMKEGFTFPLKIEDITAGAQILTFSAREVFSEYSIELTDKDLGIKKILNWNESYIFTHQSGMGVGENRFSVKLVKQQNSETKVIKIIVYPNPVQDELLVQLPPDGLPKHILIYDKLGIQIADEPQNPEDQIARISFSSRPRGVYLIRLTGLGYNHVTKVIKD